MSLSGMGQNAHPPGRTGRGDEEKKKNRGKNRTTPEAERGRNGNIARIVRTFPQKQFQDDDPFSPGVVEKEQYQRKNPYKIPQDFPFQQCHRMILLPCMIDLFADMVRNKKLTAIYVFMDMESNKKFPFCIKKFC